MTGRFAPSPTGPLHMGSLLAATASYLDARANGERWLLRIDDLDPARNVPGAEDAIKAGLDTHGLHWDGDPIHQSARTESYYQTLDTLETQGLVFFCRCSRRQLREHRIYPGTCRDHTASMADSAARIRVMERSVEFHDLIQGPQRECLAKTVGDFVIRRRDGVIAYQLATAVDDGDVEIDSVVRGADLLDNTPRQIYLMHALGLTPPRYAHIPVLTHADGSKLSKQTLAEPIHAGKADINLLKIFTWLGLRPPQEPIFASATALLAWAVDRWSLANVPQRASLVIAQQ